MTGHGHELAGGLAIKISIGIGAAIAERTSDNAGGNKPGQIIDMAICVIIHQPVFQPKHLLDTQRGRELGLGHSLGYAEIAVGIKQALARGQDVSRPVMIQRSALKDKVGSV